MPEPDEEPRRRSYYEPLRGTVYGVRFGTPGNLPGRLPEPKTRRWVPIVLGAAAVVVVVVIVILALALS